MIYFIRHPFKALTRYLPKSLLGRSLLIVVVPLVLIETISAYVFFDSHWDRVTQALADNIAGDVATLTDLYTKDPGQQNVYKALGGAHLKLRMDFLPEKTIQMPLSEKWQNGFLDVALKKQIFVPYTFMIKKEDIFIDVAVEGGVLQFTTPCKHLYSRSFGLFICWVAGTSAFFLCLAVIFMHNQVKPLRRLAIAADRFGKGRSVVAFKVEGAIEIRKVARALIAMKERLEHQVTQKTEMLAGISHDLRTPLTRMRLQLAMMAPSSEVEGLKQDVEEMRAMLEGYITLARGEGQEETVETNMRDLLLGAVRGRMTPAVAVHYSPRLLPIMPVRANALKRCMINLINNATRYGKEVWVEARVVQNSLLISIEDNGPGIPEDKIQDVFKPFFRLEGSRNIATGGVGLGLTIARDIAHAHGGDVLLSSSPDHGGLKACLILPI